MPPRFSRNQGRRSVKIKPVRRPKPSPPPPWTELPRDITGNILHRLGAVKILETAQNVCTTWRSVCKDPAMWRVIDMHIDGCLEGMAYDLQKMVQHAVDRSLGQLVDINLEHFASDELLDYISDRSGKLKRLRLAHCDDLSGEGLIEAIKRFPELEELHIIGFFISNETIEMVGRSCPLLRSFAFNGQACYDIPDDVDAKAIAKSMPELRHLEMLENGLTNEGLEAILDGCPHLESLDLRRCCHVKLTGDIAKRCSSKIKRLRYPHESTSDSDFHDGDDSESDSNEEDDSEFEFIFGFPHRAFGPNCMDYEDYLDNLSSFL